MCSTNGENTDIRPQEGPVRLTRTLISQYRTYLISSGRSPQTVSMYICYLNRFYDFLPKNKEITEKNFTRWVNSLKEQGYSDRTVNLHISSVHGLLRYCGLSEVPLTSISVSRKAPLPRLSRQEYLTLLSCARRRGSRRDFLLLKTLATIDLGLHELPYFTAEAVDRGIVELPDHKQIRIPASFREELSAYTAEEGIKNGPVFLSSRGTVPDRSNMAHWLRKLGQEAGLDPKKCTCRALHQLYLQTQEEIDRQLLSRHEEAYDALLKTEEAALNKE